LGYKNIAYIVSTGIYGTVKVTESQTLIRATELLAHGKADVGIFSLNVGGAGINCQTMNAVIFMGPCYRIAIQEQAIGISFESK
jgi:hypothetical protein